jgi:hypothetical protein
MKGIGVLALHFLNQHRLAHTAVAIEEHARHARAGRILKAPLEFFKRKPPAGIFHPALRLSKADPSRCIMKGFLLHSSGEMR